MTGGTPRRDPALSHAQASGRRAGKASPSVAQLLIVDEADPDLQDSPSLTHRSERRVKIADDADAIGGDGELGYENPTGGGCSSSNNDSKMPATPGSAARRRLFNFAPRAADANASGASKADATRGLQSFFVEDSLEEVPVAAARAFPAFSADFARRSGTDASAKKPAKRAALEASAQKRIRSHAVMATLNENQAGDDDDDEEEEEEEEEVQDGGSVEQGAEDTPSKAGHGEPSAAPDNVAGGGSDFFERSARTRTSDNTLAQLPTLRPEEIKALLDADERSSSCSSSSSSHAEEKRFLGRFMEQQFAQWRFELQQRFNVCLYGYGSKRQLLLRLARTLPRDAAVVVANGFHPGVTDAEIVGAVLANLHAPLPAPLRGKAVRATRSLADSLDLLRRHDNGGRLLYVVLHNVDGPALRGERAQAHLAQLAAAPFVRMLASVDHVNAALLWDSTHAALYNFVFHDATTFAPYAVETSFENGISLAGATASGMRNGKITATGVVHVLRSLTRNAQKAFALMAEAQLAAAAVAAVAAEPGPADNRENDDGEGSADDNSISIKKQKAKRSGAKTNANSSNVSGGIAYKALYNLCRSNFLVTTDSTFKTLLTEFRDHRIIVGRAGDDGTEYLHIPLSNKVLRPLVANLEAC